MLTQKQNRKILLVSRPGNNKQIKLAMLPNFLFWAHYKKKMEPISVFFKQSIPHYFENLPIPNTFGGWFRLSFKDWLSLVPLGAVVGGLGYVSYHAFYPKDNSLINPNIHKENPKHVDVLAVEDLGEKTAVCRCWRSKKFPFCDGSHNKFNEETGDNIGPLLVEKKK